MKEIKSRSEIEEKYKWDLTTVFKTDEDFLKEYEEVKSKSKEISKYEELIKKDLSCLYDMLSLEYELSYRVDKLFVYAHCSYDSDTSIDKYQKYNGMVENLIVEIIKLASYITPAILKYDYSDIKNEIEKDPRLKEYEFVLEKMFREKEHILSETEEKLISNLGKAFDSSSDLFDIITDTDFKYGTIKDEDGNDIELTESNYSLFLESKDRRVRKDAYDLLYKQFKQYKNTLSKTLSNHIEANNTMCTVRKYDSALDEALFSDNISKDVFDILIDTVSNNLEPLYKYYRVMKDALGVDELHFYDLYCPILDDYNKEYSFEEAKELCINTLQILGEDYVNNVKRAFDERWIDVFPNKGKRGGGYSTGIKGTNPFILFNYDGSLNDVSGIIHEVGHSMHSLYSNENNTFQDSFYTIYVGEVASTVNEFLLADYILKNSKDDKEKLNVLNHTLNHFKATLFRQTMFQEFEHSLYQLAAKGEILTSDVMSNEYDKVLRKYFGDTIVYDDNIKYEYLRVPHFYENYYVFTYATGISYATKIAKDIIDGKENARENYICFLKTGGSMYPMDELKIAGVDVHDKDVYLSAINYFNELVDEYEKLVKKVK